MKILRPAKTPAVQTTKGGGVSVEGPGSVPDGFPGDWRGPFMKKNRKPGSKQDRETDSADNIAVIFASVPGPAGIQTP